MRTAFAAALLVIIGITSARADIVYSVSFIQVGTGSGGSPIAHVTGTITTDGIIGAITPNDIVNWTLTDVETETPIGPILSTYTTGSASSGPPGWTDGSVSATATGLIFDYGPQFTNSLGFGAFSFVPWGCPISGTCGTRFVGSTHWYDGTEINVFATGGIDVPSAVPGPVMGAGIPGLLMAGIGVFSWWRRKAPVQLLSRMLP